MNRITGIISPAVADRQPELNDEVIAFVISPMFGGDDFRMEVEGRGITLEAAMNYIAGDTLIQDAFPMLSATERETIMTGMSPEEQEEFFDE